jgi:hypothetical protein
MFFGVEIEGADVVPLAQKFGKGVRADVSERAGEEDLQVDLLLANR